MDVLLGGILDDVVELLLAGHADPNGPVNVNPKNDADYAPATPLLYAAETGNQRIASMLIAAGARNDAKGPDRRTVLHFAGAQVGIIPFLIEKGADVSARDAEGVAPLDNAVWVGSLDAAAILLAHDARLNEPEPKTGATAINEAAYRGHAQIVQYLLRFKPDLDVPDRHGYTALENAVRMKKEGCALLLLGAETKGQKPHQFFEKTMDTAVQKDEAPVVETLLERGVPLNGVLPSGSTPLGAAAFAGAVQVVSVLLRKNADPNIGSRAGTSPLEDASLKGFDEIAGMLVDRGAEMDHVNKGSGATALYTAASFGRTSVVKLLLDKGANPNVCGANRRSAYQVALEQGNRDAADSIQIHGGAGGCK